MTNNLKVIASLGLSNVASMNIISITDEEVEFFIGVNDGGQKIVETVEIEIYEFEEGDESIPGFEYNDEIYYLSDFIRVSN